MNEPRLIELEEKKLVGVRIWTSLAENKTRELWQSFRPRIVEIGNVISGSFYSVQIYDDNLSFDQFTPNTQFEKWAAMEVSDIDSVPARMEPLILSGRYAVFVHKGTPADFFRTTSPYIFGTWLPNSEFELDQRPQFEIMESGYDPRDPNSEEEVWIPIKPKQ